METTTTERVTLIKTVALDAVTILKNFILAKEQELQAQKTLTDLKPLVETLRKDEKKVKFPGAFRNKPGEYIITHVETGQTHAKVDVLRRFVTEGILTEAQYAEATFFADATHNRVKFSPGQP